MKYAILAVLCLSATVFGAVSYDAGTTTLTYGAPGDLSVMVDPVGEGQDLETNPVLTPTYGNLTKNGFNALNPQVIGFNDSIILGNLLNNADAKVITTMIATYAGSNTLTLNHFAANYQVGGNCSLGRVQYSGTDPWKRMGTNPATTADPRLHLTDAISNTFPTGGSYVNNWFIADLSVSDANAGVTALGFVADGRDSQITSVGRIYVTLSDATEASFDYLTFGGVAGSGLGFFYQAPANKFITRIECTTTNNAGSNSTVPMDDIGFVIGGGSAPLYIHAHPGDVNNDGACNVVDLGVLAKYYDQTGLATSVVDPYGAGSWTKADFNNDGIVNVVDLGVLAKNYDWVGAPAVPTPEPATLSLLGLAAAALIRRKK